MVYFHIQSVAILLIALFFIVNLLWCTESSPKARKRCPAVVQEYLLHHTSHFVHMPKVRCMHMRLEIYNAVVEQQGLVYYSQDFAIPYLLLIFQFQPRNIKKCILDCVKCLTDKPLLMHLLLSLSSFVPIYIFTEEVWITLYHRNTGPYYNIHLRCRRAVMISPRTIVKVFINYNVILSTRCTFTCKY